jgi:hypothetical protein
MPENCVFLCPTPLMVTSLFNVNRMMNLKSLSVMVLVIAAIALLFALVSIVSDHYALALRVKPVFYHYYYHGHYYHEH